MSDTRRIEFEDLDLHSTEGQLLLAAFAIISGSIAMENVDDILIDLIEVHERLCFEKELKNIIEDES